MISSQATKDLVLVVATVGRRNTARSWLHR